MKNSIEKTDQSQETFSRSQVAYQVTMALSNIDRHYQKEINAYAEELQQQILETEKIKNSISTLQKSIEEEETVYENLKYDIHYEMRLLERLNERFIQDAKLLGALQSFTVPDEHASHFSEKKATLQYQLDEILETERSLLQKELERQNRLQKLEPVRKEIETLRYKLKEIELEKHFLETTKIHQISQLRQIQQTDSQQKDDNENNIVDTEIESE